MDKTSKYLNANYFFRTNDTTLFIYDLINCNSLNCIDKSGHSTNDQPKIVLVVIVIFSNPKKHTENMTYRYEESA